MKYHHDLHHEISTLYFYYGVEAVSLLICCCSVVIHVLLIKTHCTVCSDFIDMLVKQPQFNPQNIN